MTAHKAMSAKISLRLHELTAGIVASLPAQIPFYIRLPAEELHGEVADIIAHNVRVFGDLLRDVRLAHPDELDRQRQSARRRAEEGVPLDAVLEAYHLGTLLLWEKITVDIAPSDVVTLLPILLGFLRQITAAVSAEYMDARQAVLHQEHDARRSLITALLAGAPLDTPAQHAGLHLPERYTVLVLATEPHPDESREPVSAPVAGRRKVRRIQDAFERFIAEPVLSVLDTDGGVVLLPSESDTRLREMICAASLAAGAPVTAAAAVAAPADVPAAVRQATEVLELVRRLAHPPGLYRLTDVLLEYQLSRPSAARIEFARLLDPLTDKPDLLDTLRSYLRNGLSRRDTATELYLHPNTVDYRLRRIAHLTGLNPASPADLQRLRAAILAR